MSVRLVAGYHPVVGRDPVVKGFDHPVLKGGHQCRGLEHRARLGGESDGHVVGLVEAHVRGVPRKVDHGSDRACLDIHDHSASHVDGHVVLDLSAESLVDNVLEGYVQRCPDIQSVFRLHIGAVVVLDLLPVVRRSEPDLSLLAVKDIVIFALDANMAAPSLVRLLVPVVLDIADRTPRQHPVRVLAGVSFPYDDSAFVLSFLHQRELFKTLNGSSVEVCEKSHVPFPLIPALDDHPVVLIGVDSRLLGEPGCEFPSLSQPVVLKAVGLVWIILALEILL